MDTDTAPEHPEWEEIQDDAPAMQSTTFVAAGIRRILSGGIEAAAMETEKQRELEADDRIQDERKRRLAEALESATDADADSDAEPDWQLLPSTPPPDHLPASSITHTDTGTPRPLTRKRRTTEPNGDSHRTGNRDSHGAGNNGDGYRAADTTATAAEATEAGTGNETGGDPAAPRLENPRVSHPTGDRWRPVFLAALRLCPNVRLACEAAAVTRATAMRAVDNDAAFAEEYKLACDEGTDLLHACAFQRATEGVLRPIYQGGIRVGYEAVYSDKLTIELLRAHRPEQFKAAPTLAMKIASGGTPKIQTPEQVLATLKRITPLIRNRAAADGAK